MSDFATCTQCGRIFANPGGQFTLCQRCRGDETQAMTARDALRVLKSTLRDAQAKGQLMTISDLAEATEVDEQRIWGFINDGEIDTASFNDPQVRDYVFKRRRELLKQNLPAHEEKHEPQEHRGFHHRADEDERRR